MGRNRSDKKKTSDECPGCVHRVTTNSTKKVIIKGSSGWARVKKMVGQAVLIYHHCANSFHTTTLHLPPLDLF